MKRNDTALKYVITQEFLEEWWLPSEMNENNTQDDHFGDDDANEDSDSDDQNNEYVMQSIFEMP